MCDHGKHIKDTLVNYVHILRDVNSSSVGTILNNFSDLCGRSHTPICIIYQEC